ncbi:nuclear transport factor 2 family protein [Paenarthrobacter sp. NyZ202]|uniref:nuclear transport factor 2 family protein n=1 Tax=Paenarthrobacter sp. NyZ202 TaxID=3402689 RepID=UPI003CF5A2A2
MTPSQSSSTGQDIRTAEVGETAWTDAFAAKSEDAFGSAFAEDVVLEATALLKPLHGRTNVQTSMGAASNYYTSLAFTHEATNGDRTYIEWEATGASGVRFSGVTVLTRNEAGLIRHISISHRPLAAVLEFSAEMYQRTKGKIQEGHFRPND